MSVHPALFNPVVDKALGLCAVKYDNCINPLSAISLIFHPEQAQFPNGFWARRY